MRRKYRNKDWLKGKLEKDKKHPREIANKFDVTENAIRNWMRKYNLGNHSPHRGRINEIGNKYDFTDNLGFDHTLTIKDAVENKEPGSYWLCEWENDESLIKAGTQLRNGEIFKSPPKLGTIERLYLDYKEGATKRNLNFEISLVEFQEMITQDCFYCGKPPSRDIKNRVTHPRVNFKYTGIDRVNNKKGYTKQNTVPCCWECNKFKGSMNGKEFLSLIEKIYKNFPRSD